jgi:HK97 family phage major capsid protein
MKTLAPYVRLLALGALAVTAGLLAAAGLDPSIALALGMDPHTASGLLLAEGAVAIDPQMIKDELKKIGDQVKEMGQKALDHAKKTGDMQAEMKPQVDQLLSEQGRLMARLQEVEQKQARRAGPDPLAARTVGQMFVADDAFKAWVESGGIKSTQSGYVGAVPRAALTSVGSPGVPPDLQPGVVVPGVRRLTVRDLLMPGTTSSNMVQFVKETGFTNNAAPVSETAQKPESSLVYTLNQQAVVTIAHWVKASKQVLDDFAGLTSMIDGRLRYGLKLVEETQLLKGSGVGNNLNGIYTQATTYVAPITVPSPTKIDTIRLMLLQAELALYPATGIVLHPADWAAIELTKDSTGGYIFANPQAQAQPSLWGRPVVATPAMTVDTALVGAFSLGAQIFDREDANVVISTENQDDFIKNMVTIRCEERLALAVYRPEAFVKNPDLPAT